LEAKAKSFLEKGILPACNEIIGANVEGGEVNGAVYAQLLVSVSDGHWWIARLVAAPGSDYYYLLHCHGDQEYMVLATAMFCEFYVSA
jgi:hypothetical protein